MKSGYTTFWNQIGLSNTIVLINPNLIKTKSNNNNNNIKSLNSKDFNFNIIFSIFYGNLEWFFESI